MNHFLCFPSSLELHHLTCFYKKISLAWLPLPICLPQTRFGKHYLVEIFSSPLLPSPLTLVAGPDFELDFSPPLFLPLPLPDPPAVHPPLLVSLRPSRVAARPPAPQSEAEQAMGRRAGRGDSCWGGMKERKTLKFFPCCIHLFLAPNDRETFSKFLCKTLLT